MACVNCACELHRQCKDKDDATGLCCCRGANSSIPNDTNDEEEEVDDEGYDDVGRKRPRKNRSLSRDENLRDIQSTGRKRAARLFPLNRTEACEWKYLKFAGGGQYPIIGCIEGLQQARHHGPDKIVTNNEVGNVHRICHSCHNRWHARNDATYVWSSIYTKHDSTTKVTDLEAFENEKQWSTKKLIKVVD